MKVMVLGATGMLGHMLLRRLVSYPAYQGHGVVRDAVAIPRLRTFGIQNFSCLRDAMDMRSVQSLLLEVRPDVVVNCISVAKGKMQSPEWAYPVYSLLPRRLSYACRVLGIRMIQIGSDGVFSGKKGQYVESDIPDAEDIYGSAKLLGEVEGPGALTLRLSMIGPQLNGVDGLLEWFLANRGKCRGYTRSIFSGLPTTEISRVLAEYVLPDPGLSGIYHVAARPISKYHLLQQLAIAFGNEVELEGDESVVMDRSLCADRFRDAVGYVPPEWRRLVQEMRDFHIGAEGA